MSDKIKITMLGGTGSGKTCYMLGMYAGMQMSMHGFSLSTTDQDIGVALDAKWEKITHNTGEDRWPRKSFESENYAFNLNYAFNPIIGFEWLDYRGNAMSDKSTDDDDVEELRKQILESSCLFLCVSGEYLSEKVNKRNFANLLDKTKVNRMGRYISYLSENLPNKNREQFPIVILITKCDYCIDIRSKEELIEDIKKLFTPLFVKKSGWLLMICPVSLGEDLAQDKDRGVIAPKFLHLPVIFALFSALRSSALQDLRQSKQSKIMQWISSKIIKWISNREIPRSNRSMKISKHFREKMAPLVRELRKAERKGDVYFYLHGKRIEI